MMSSEFLANCFDSLNILPLADITEIDSRFIRQAIAIHLIGIACGKRNTNLVFKLNDCCEVYCVDSEDHNKDADYVSFVDNMGCLDKSYLVSLKPEQININSVGMFLSDINNKHNGLVDHWIDTIYDDLQQAMSDNFLDY